LRRAEALVALRNVGEEIARRITQVLDQQEPAVVMGAITRTREALESADDGGPIQLLDL
jgi:hypothetical protein